MATFAGPRSPMSSASEGGSSPSSCDSGKYGLVARAGFTRMYALSKSSLAPLDQSMDYRSEYNTAKEDKDAAASSTQQNREEQFQLLYANGRHYFHGDIPIPEDLLGTERGRKEEISLADLPVLLPHFQQQQDELMAVDSVSQFRSELRDVIYQMEEVGEFMVEELSKAKTVARIEMASRGLHWIVSSANPVFFELQTYASTSDSFVRAGVQLIVMKLVVRDVLLDIIYYRDSYFVTLRDSSAHEMALEDMFIPNGSLSPVLLYEFARSSTDLCLLRAVACVGPCFQVRRYSDADLKQLLLWCALPEDLELRIEGKTSTLHAQPTNTQLSGSTSHSRRAILHANDTQLYCLFSDANASRAQPKNSYPKGDCKSESSSEDRDDRVFFQFNQYVYEGEISVQASELDDLAKLSGAFFPRLRAHAPALSFCCEDQDLEDNEGEAAASATIWPAPELAQVQRQFRTIAATLLDLVSDSQTWIENFVREVDLIGRECAEANTRSSAWLGDHLKAWLEAEDGSEVLFELELARRRVPWLSFAQVDLLLWKGIVNAVLMIVLYRRGSFYVVLRAIPEEGEDDLRVVNDGLVLFGLLPPLSGKGRGYLVRQFPVQSAGDADTAWLAGAKLLLWQTSASLEREERAEELAMKNQTKSAPADDWFLTEDHHSAEQPPSEIVRDANPTQAAGFKHAAEHGEQRKDKVGRRHHLPPLASGVKAAASGAAPWDLRTGRPI